METKKAIRQQVYRARKCMEHSDWQEKTDHIASAVISHPFFLEATDLYSYVDYQNEAGTRKIMEEAWKLGKRVWVPKVVGKTMRFGCINSFQELRPGAHGILEPEILSETSDSKDTRCNLMIMPGVAFDLNRGRVGYGGGYYDRYLSEHSDIHTIAIAFDFQIFPEVPGEIHDIKPKVLITETRVIQ
ncbi:5-formyltetrahydrofolate cyclo-ligase [Bariatricus sp. SGI.154]|uniref:5-formyltetrahydrofolate cyclo-ligase n=1 Tax=Bariatricus sp. SGI.154 TaxID=3420549 RepID=UPI003D056E9C